jgi:uncharacterized RDD family membrane protein YckC
VTPAALDTLFTAETPEGITLALRPAGVVPRFYAWSFDFGVRLAVMIAGGMTIGQLPGVGVAGMLILYFLLEWFYPVLFELMPGSATPGKRMLGLQVVMDSGLPVTPAASLLRNLLRAADFLPFLNAFAVVSMLWRSDFKRIGDLAAGTLVVYADNVKLHGELPAATPVAPARALTAREQAAIVGWAGRATRLTAARLEELALIARPVIDDGSARASRRDATERLLGVAQWLMGKR